MLSLLFDLIAGLLFVLSSGILYHTRFNENPFLVGGAASFAIISTVILIWSAPQLIGEFDNFLNPPTEHPLSPPPPDPVWCSVGGDRIKHCRFEGTAKERVNLRIAPGLDGVVVAVAERGQKLLIVGEENGWYRVHYRFSEDRWRPSLLISNARRALLPPGATEANLYVARNMVDVTR